VAEWLFMRFGIGEFTVVCMHISSIPCQVFQWIYFEVVYKGKASIFTQHTLSEKSSCPQDCSSKGIVMLCQLKTDGLAIQPINHPTCHTLFLRDHQMFTFMI
jgi:hypothetical protein